jgi:hypothetical protein
MHIYVNAKMIHVETVPGIRRGRMGENTGGVNSNMIYLMHFQNLCKCYNVPNPAQQ